MHPTPSHLLVFQPSLQCIYKYQRCVVRYRYNAAQVLAEILRQELSELDDESNNSFSADNDSFECEDVVEVNDDVPDELDEAPTLVTVTRTTPSTTMKLLLLVLLLLLMVMILMSSTVTWRRRGHQLETTTVTVTT